MKKVGAPKKQFCVHGHDTFVCGRTKAYLCNECRRLSRRVASPKRLKFIRFCSKGHDKDVVGRNKKGYCKECLREANREWKKKNPSQAKEHALKQRHNITLKDRDKILNNQGGKCAICKRFEDDLKSPLHVDHDHNCCSGEKSCGKCIRGLLCYDCNRGLGAFKDSDLLLKNAQVYLSLTKRYI
jgi:hypothetical protein